jgi:hypothetical protein
MFSFLSSSLFSPRMHELIFLAFAAFLLLCLAGVSALASVPSNVSLYIVTCTRNAPCCDDLWAAMGNKLMVISEMENFKNVFPTLCSLLKS